jgi:hypothetical protein
MITRNNLMIKLKDLPIKIGLLLYTLIICSNIAGDQLAKTHYLPDLSNLKGWKMVGEPQVAEGMENLFAIINGEAVLYTSRGFKRAQLATYLSTTGKEIYVQVFEMNDPSAAKEVYDIKSGEGKGLNIGDEAVLESYYLNFRKTRFQITISGAIPDKTDKAELEVLAREIDLKLSDRK